MKKVTVFGKLGSGKSTMSKRLAAVKGIPLYPLNLMVYKKNGDLVDRQTYNKKHEDMLRQDQWIIDGFAPIASTLRRGGYLNLYRLALFDELLLGDQATT